MRKFLIPIAMVLSLGHGLTALAGDYSVGTSTIGTLLDNPATAEILEKHMPGFTTNPQVGMTRELTLEAIQSFAPDMVTEEALAAIDADLAGLETSGD